MIRFIHTADWQIGKPFARVEHQDKQSRLRNARIEMIKRIGEIAGQHQASFVLVAGDLFDSSTPDASTVAAACRAIGSIGIPVLAIPGNHDHGGPGSVWRQEFFLRQQAEFAKNLRVLTEPKEFEECGVLIFPCPLSRQQTSEDMTAWLRSPDLWATAPTDKIRIVLAHGSVQNFSSVSDEEESSGQPNLIDLSALDSDAFDYVALGDWHGTRQVDGKTWYSGTPEPDRFPKGENNDPGNILLVEIAGRGEPPIVTPIRSARIGWREMRYSFTGESDLEYFKTQLKGLFDPSDHDALLRLELTGSLGFSENDELKKILESQEAQLLRLKLENKVLIRPSREEINQLQSRANDPLISTIAARLVKELEQGDDRCGKADRALRQLWEIVEREGVRS